MREAEIATTLSRVALEMAGDPREAASICLSSGITLLAFCQSMWPTDDPEKMLDETFAFMRQSFYDMADKKVLQS